MDAARFGPVFLKQAAIAELVVESLFKGVELGHYELGPFVVMSNHVHVLMLPSVPASRLLKSLKGYTARHANLLLGRTGETFWQRESYDRAVRNPDELKRIGAYIENNPVKAGVVDQAENFPWSSANPKWQERLRGLRSQDCERGTPRACATKQDQETSGLEMSDTAPA
jgi:putative transposase